MVDLVGVKPNPDLTLRKFGSITDPDSTLEKTPGSGFATMVKIYCIEIVGKKLYI